MKKMTSLRSTSPLRDTQNSLAPVDTSKSASGSFRRIKGPMHSWSFRNKVPTTGSDRKGEDAGGNAGGVDVHDAQQEGDCARLDPSSTGEAKQSSELHVVPAFGDDGVQDPPASGVGVGDGDGDGASTVVDQDDASRDDMDTDASEGKAEAGADSRRRENRTEATSPSPPHVPAQSSQGVDCGRADLDAQVVVAEKPLSEDAMSDDDDGDDAEEEKEEEEEEEDTVPGRLSPAHAGDSSGGACSVRGETGTPESPPAERPDQVQHHSASISPSSEDPASRQPPSSSSSMEVDTEPHPSRTVSTDTEAHTRVEAEHPSAATSDVEDIVKSIVDEVARSTARPDELVPEQAALGDGEHDGDSSEDAAKPVLEEQTGTTPELSSTRSPRVAALVPDDDRRASVQSADECTNMKASEQDAGAIPLDTDAISNDSDDSAASKPALASLPPRAEVGEDGDETEHSTAVSAPTGSVGEIPSDVGSRLTVSAQFGADFSAEVPDEATEGSEPTAESTQSTVATTMNTKRPLQEAFGPEPPMTSPPTVRQYLTICLQSAAAITRPCPHMPGERG